MTDLKTTRLERLWLAGLLIEGGAQRIRVDTSHKFAQVVLDLGELNL